MTPPPIKNSPPSPWDVIHNFRDYSQGQRDLHLNSGKKRKREFSGGHVRDFRRGGVCVAIVVDFSEIAGAALGNLGYSRMAAGP